MGRYITNEDGVDMPCDAPVLWISRPEEDLKFLMLLDLSTVHDVVQYRNNRRLLVEVDQLPRIFSPLSC